MAKVLIAEDDLLISDLLEDAVENGGYEVCGVATTVAQALAIGRDRQPDLAILDVRLAEGGDGTEVAARLTASRSIGILYASGNIEQLLTTAVTGHACLKKPYRPSDVVRALRVVEHMILTGAAPAQLPPGLILLQQLPAGTDRS
jgi:two-component system, response regulator PdtaR